MEMVSATFFALIVFTLTACIKRVAVRFSGCRLKSQPSSRQTEQAGEVHDG